ncbi:MAG TPA: CocE/NonD family hydrolase [Candidatus Dormibacteraeota bacterium]|nr:CocE/NonD family hydrolase [Candidatus Dormibacteraeota bacterium]
MRVVQELPHPVRVIEHEWIPLPDGARLGARIWLPELAERQPVPALLEYLPYRKGDATALRDAPMHTYFAGHGYAAVRVDLRGSGESDGVLEDEYLPLEQEDALVVLRWLAAQPWCSGRVGIIGKSWGGFNGLQIAARRPPELGAVISVASTDDRYADDVHYMGGCVLAWDMLSWGSTMLAYNARPPDPAVVGDRWRPVWLARMARTRPFVHTWLRHQRRDDYWRQGSVCEDYAQITCPVLMVGGWADAYRNAILRFLARYPGPAKGLIGPWGHLYPQDGAPGPAIGFLQEAVRWWDHWLKGVENGVMDGPALTVWMQEAVPPRASYAVRPGRWVGLERWPSPAVVRRRLYPAGAELRADPSRSSERILHRGSLLHGLEAGVWCAWGGPADFPGDQRPEDGLSLCFTSPPLAEPLEILGQPEVEVTVASDRPLALLVARLCDVWPEGPSTLITRGLLNLTHRDGHEAPCPLEPGRAYRVRVPLNAIAYAVPPGHRLRLALSSCYWPWAWPSPEPVTLTVSVGGDACWLELPVLRPGAPGVREPLAFPEPEAAPGLAFEPLGPAAGERTLRRRLGAGTIEVEHEPGYLGGFRLSRDGLTYQAGGRDRYRIREDDPLSAWVAAERTITIARGSWRTRVETRSVMTATASTFVVSDLLEAFEGETRVFVKAWEVEVPRDHG